MKKLALLMAVLMTVFVLAGCGNRVPAQSTGNGGEAAKETGTLVFTANGEDFIREGFLSKDGWELSFEHAYVTLAAITAYQTDPPYDTDQGWDISYQVKTELPGVFTVDLAAADSNPAFVGEVNDAPAGRYNALSWDLVKAPSGPSQGYIMMLVGRAEKDGEIINFVLRFDREVVNLGGDYIGDERKGILAANGTADLEMTFHFDHLFGDGEEDEDDSLNLEALGFAPLAALAVDGKVDIDTAGLQQFLSPADFELLLNVFTHLCHVGEGHCLSKFK